MSVQGRLLICAPGSVSTSYNNGAVEGCVPDVRLAVELHCWRDELRNLPTCWKGHQILEIDHMSRRPDQHEWELSA